MTVWPKRHAIVKPRTAEDIARDEDVLRRAINLGADFLELVRRSHITGAEAIRLGAAQRLELMAQLLTRLKHSPEYDETP